MKLPLSWLRDHVEHGLSSDDLAERLTATGTLVEGVERRGISDAHGNLDQPMVGTGSDFRGTR